MKSIAEAMPFAGALGLEIAEASAERVRATMLVRPDLCTAGHILHGGAIMALADCLGALGAYLALSDGATGTTTIESKTNFLGPAKEGAIISAEAVPLHKGRRTSVWQTRIVSAEGKPVALTIQTQLALSAG